MGLPPFGYGGRPTASKKELGAEVGGKDDGLVRRTVRVTRAIGGHPEGVGLSDISRETGLSKATCLRILNDLVVERWITFDDQDRTYRISLGMLSVVGRIFDGQSAFGYLKRILRSLSERTKETAGFDLLVAPHVLVVAQEAGPQLITQAARPVPRTQSVWVTATGRVFLAGLTQDQVMSDFADTFPATSAKSRKAGIEEFCTRLSGVQAQGFAVVRDELEMGASAVAAPVMVDGRTQYAAWVGGPSYRIGPERTLELATAVMEAAEELAALLQVNPIQFDVEGTR